MAHTLREQCRYSWIMGRVRRPFCKISEDPHMEKRISARSHQHASSRSASRSSSRALGRSRGWNCEYSRACVESSWIRNKGISRGMSWSYRIFLFCSFHLSTDYGHIVRDESSSLRIIHVDAGVSLFSFQRAQKKRTKGIQRLWKHYQGEKVVMDCLDGCLSMLFLLFLVGLVGFLVSNPIFWIILLVLFLAMIWIGSKDCDDWESSSNNFYIYFSLRSQWLRSSM